MPVYGEVFISTMNIMNTLVFVEDDAEVGSLIAAYLAKHDLNVIVEPRGDKAEEVIASIQPNLVLLDIMLPGKDGMSICRDLRGKYAGPIVLLTSLDSDISLFQDSRFSHQHHSTPRKDDLPDDAAATDLPYHMQTEAR